MADVKWIKITTDIFDDEKILLIETLPDADSIIVIWFKLLCMAGKQNNSGVFMMNDKIPFTDKMLSAIFRRNENTVKLAISTFEKFGMIEVVDGVITIPNWGKHQSADKIEKYNEYQKNYMREYREKQKLIACKTNSNTNVNDTEEEQYKQEQYNEYKKEDNTLSESNGDSGRERINYTKIIDLYNRICISLPKCSKLTDARKRLIKCRMLVYSESDLENAFINAEESDFLSGRNGTWNGANIDWILNATNIQKILEGNYKNKNKQAEKSFIDKWKDA